MGFHIISSVLLICCIVGVFTSAIPDDKDYRQLPPKRNFVKDLEANEKDEMSKFALHTLNSLDPTYSKRILCSILEGKKQFASGIVYKLKLSVVIIPEEELKPSANSQSLCNEREDKVVCEIDVLRSYAATDYSPINAQNSLEADRSMFHEFIQKYNKSYDSEEEHVRRFHIFRGNLKKIQLLNLREEGTAEYGINEFADLSKSEFKNYYLGLIPSESRIEKQAIIPSVRLPQEFDWRKYNAVTPVKNQGMCGSCWAFSVTGNVEGQWAVKHKNLVSLSEQELIDCDKYDNGCMGGYMTDAYKAIEDLGGLEKENDYPYEGSNDKCVFSKSKAVVEVVDSVNITSNETEMAQWLFKNGPISVALNAFAMQFYIRGVSKPWKFLCNPNDLDHGVLIVGFGVYKQKLPYWIIKNSWGSHWGESGYYRLYRGSGACGVNKMASSAIVS